MKINKTIYTFCIILLSTYSAPETKASQINADLNNENIHILGAHYVQRSSNAISFSRFNENILNLPSKEIHFNAFKAKTNTGIRIVLKTSSPKITLHFITQEGENRGAEFAVFQNGTLSGEFKFNVKQSLDAMPLTIVNNFPGHSTVFEISMPSMANVALSKLQMDEDVKLEPLEHKEERPIYIALGNSITHGVGQGSASHLTYPFLLSEQLDYNLYNLAVGGSRISQPMAEMLQEFPQADIITILIGYNDLHFNNKSVDQYVSDYKIFLETVRTNQPKAKIYCISLTHTRSKGNLETGISPGNYRKALKKLLQNRDFKNDSNIIYIEGNKITSESNLRQDFPNDKTHFSITGAALFADELYSILTQN